jgi:uncharacterized BrkB/YihY/UPF0761 family membrane protein
MFSFLRLFTALNSRQYSIYENTPYLSKLFNIKLLSFIFLLLTLLYSATPLRHVSDDAEKLFLFTNAIALLLFVTSFIIIFYVTVKNTEIKRFRVIFHTLICTVFSMFALSYSDFQVSPESPSFLSSSASFMSHEFSDFFRSIKRF